MPVDDKPPGSNQQSILTNEREDLSQNLAVEIANAHHTTGYIIDFVIIIVMTIVIYYFSTHFDWLENLVNFTKTHESWELDELIMIMIFWGICITIFAIRRLLEMYKIRKVLLKANQELLQAYTEIRTLKGIIPICSSCKKVRDDQGYWHQVESYIKRYATVDFSHGICPECAKKLYPEMEIYKSPPPSDST